MGQLVIVDEDNNVRVVPTGPRGLRGLQGPRGERGPAGLPGTPPDYVTPRDYGAPNNGIGDDFDGIMAAKAVATAEGKILWMSGEYVHSETITWTEDEGPLTVWAEQADIRYTGSEYGWFLHMADKASGLPSPRFFGGKYRRSASAIGSFLCHDLRNYVFRDMEFISDTASGIDIHKKNHGGWTERGKVQECRFTRHSTAVKCSLYRTSATSKSITSGLAEVVIGTHEFVEDDRLNVKLVPADSRFDGDRLVLAVTPTTVIFSASGEPDLASTACGGNVNSRGSFARMQIENNTFSTGVFGEAHIDIEEGVGPYGGRILGAYGNIVDGSSLLKIRGNGAWNGAKVGLFDVELAASGECYLVDAPDDWIGGRAEWVGNIRTTGSVLFYKPIDGSTPIPSGTPPWEPSEFPGGIKPDLGGVIDARDSGLILPESDDEPLDDDLPFGQSVNGRVSVNVEKRRIRVRVGPDNFYFAQMDKSEQVPRGERFVRLTSDVTRTSDDALSAQSELTLTDILANTEWGLEGVLYVTGPVGAKIALDVPGGSPAAEIRWRDESSTLITSQLSNTPVSRIIPASGTMTAIRIFGDFQFGQFPGDLSFLWGQETIDVSPVTIHKGSWIKGTEAST